LRAPISRLKKNDIIKMGKWTCEHGHSGLEHYPCWMAANPDTQRLGYFDIETTGFKADWDWMLTYAILDDKTDKVYSNLIKVKDLRNEKIMDSVVVSHCVEDMQNFDILIGFYTTRFDLPFVRTRAVVFNLDFPGYDELLTKDVYYTVRNKFSLGSNRLQNACKILLGNSDKTGLDRKIWQTAQRCGNKDSLNYIQEHCIIDVKELKKLYHKVHPFHKAVYKSV
jgi:uncharacterized protein YprB with RNaseH-like and TPR domain